MHDNMANQSLLEKMSNSAFIGIIYTSGLVLVNNAYQLLKRAVYISTGQLYSNESEGAFRRYKRISRK